jgi:hypothetical protein
MLKDICKDAVECMMDTPRSFSSRGEPPMDREYSTDRRREPSMDRRREPSMDSGDFAWLEGSYKSIIITIITFIITILLIALLGKFLWNVSVVPLFTVVRPVESGWQIIGLMVLLSLLR